MSLARSSKSGLSDARRRNTSQEYLNSPNLTPNLPSLEWQFGKGSKPTTLFQMRSVR